MERDKIKNNLLSMKELATRWGYKSAHGARRRYKYDRKFPEPIKIINDRILLFWLPDIEQYEALRGGIDVSQNRYSFYESKEEWHTKSREEREKQRGHQYSDEDWEEIENKSKLLELNQSS